MTTWNELPTHLVSKIRSDSVTAPANLPGAVPVLKYSNAITEVDGIRFDSRKEVVLDPFCGSGTTAKMAMLTGRKFIGFEISAEYCDIAEKRIASVGKDIPLFEAD